MPKKRIHKVFKKRSEFKTILLDLIDDPERPIRSDLSPESVEDLTRSIKSVGLIEPLVVKPVGKRYELLVGHRRLLACEMADFIKAPCYVMDVDQKRGDLIKIHENVFRRDISPLDEAKYLAYLRKQYTLKIAEIGSLINRSTGYVSERLMILRYPAQMIEALESGAFPISVAKELMRIKDVKVRNVYLKAAIKSGITYPLAVQWRKQWQSANRGAPKIENKESKDISPEEKPVLTVPCAICGKRMPIYNSRMIYVHPKCYEAVKS